MARAVWHQSAAPLNERDERKFGFVCYEHRADAMKGRDGYNIHNLGSSQSMNTGSW
jgi:hypothetical protein